MANKMNIDMGDFFGEGAAEPPKKEPKSGRGFGFAALLGKSKPSPTAAKRSSSSAKKDEFENPLSRGSGGKSSPTSQQIFQNKPSASKLSVDHETRVATKPVSEASLPKTSSTATISSQSNPRSQPSETSIAKSSPIATDIKPKLTVDTSQPALEAASVASPGSKSGKVPPPLPPRPISPRSVENPAQVEEKALKGLVTARSSGEMKLGDASKGESERLPIPQKTGTGTTARLSGAKSNSDSKQLDSALAGRNGQTDSKPGHDADVPKEDLRYVVAPWTVFSADPEKTLANQELRSAVAPWTTEPEPEREPEPRPSQAEARLHGTTLSQAETTIPITKEIAMDSFFAGGANVSDDEADEFVNPLLVSDTHDNDGDEEIVSKPSVTKKTWIASRTGGSVVEKPKPVSVPEKVETKKKVIDYGEIFKPSEDDDDGNDAFMNDPEFRDAPDFEW